MQDVVLPGGDPAGELRGKRVPGVVVNENPGRRH